MSRNPFWTADNAALVRSLISWQYPDGVLSFTASTDASYEYQAVFVGELDGVKEGSDFIQVTLVGGTTYGFLVYGEWQPTITIFDRQGYLMLSTDGDDVSPGMDGYLYDSILGFEPDGSGVYYLHVEWEYVPTAHGRYSIAAIGDVGGDGRNGLIQTPTSSALINAAYLNILRSPASAVGDSAFVNRIIADVDRGVESLPVAYAEILQRGDGTTSVATLSYQFFTGSTPSAAGLDFLVSPTGPNPNNLNSDYYANFGTVNRYINFAANLGGAGEGKGWFLAEYGGLSVSSAMDKAYQEIFGGDPSDAKVNSLLFDQIPDGQGGTFTRLEYFATFGGDGTDGLATKAAMVGWLLATAATEGVGMYAKSNDAYLMDLADGAPYAIDLIGTYGRPEFDYAG